MKRIVTLSAVIGITAIVMAFAPFGKVFDDTYSIAKTSALGKAKCAVCHVKATGGKLNPYGKDMATAMGESKKLTPAMLHSIDTKDSDGDGRKNIDEIRADKMPGKAD